MNPLQIRSEHNETHAWTVRQTTVVNVVEGALWLTRSGDPEDVVLERGGSLRLKPGRWVAQSLGSTRYGVEVLSGKEVGDGQAPLFPVLQRL